MKRWICSAVCIVCALFSVTGYPDDDIPVIPVASRVTRERIEGIVNMFINLKNHSQSEQKIDLTIEFLTQLGDTMDTRYKRRIRVKPGKETPVTIHEKRVQYFERYRIIVVKGDRRGVFLGHVGVLKPWKEPAEPLEGTWCVQVMGYDQYYIQRRATAYVKVKIKNYGSLTAEGVKARIRFFLGKAKKPVGTVTRVFNSGRLTGWAEKAQVLKIIRVPPYDRITVEAVADTPPEQDQGKKKGVTGPVFTTRPRVEAGEFFFRKHKGRTVIKGKVRNGLSVPVRNVRIVISFMGKNKKRLGSSTVKAKGVIKPGSTVPFSAPVRKIPGFETYAYTVSYKRVK